MPVELSDDEVFGRRRELSDAEVFGGAIGEELSDTTPPESFESGGLHYVPPELQQAEEQAAIEREAGGYKVPEWLRQVVPQALKLPAKIGMAAGAMQTGRLRWPTDEEVSTPVVSPDQMKMVMPYAYAADRAREMFPESKTAQIAAGVTGGMTDAVSGFTSPENLATLPFAPAGKLAQRAIAGVFLGQAISGTPEQWEAFNNAPELTDKIRIATSMGLGYGLPLWAGAATFRKPKPKPQPGPKIDDGLEQKIQDAQRNINEAATEKRFSDAVKWQQVLDDLQAEKVKSNLPVDSVTPARVQSEGPKVVEPVRTTEEMRSAETDTPPKAADNLPDQTQTMAEVPIPQPESTAPAVSEASPKTINPQQAFQQLTEAFTAGARDQTAQNIRAGKLDNLTYRKPATIELLRKSNAHEFIENPDGTLTVTGVKDSQGNWVRSKTEPASPKVASVSVMITKRMEAELKARGITDEQIYRMKPAEAQAILSQPADIPLKVAGSSPDQIRTTAEVAQPIQPGIEAALAEIQRRNAPSLSAIQEAAIRLPDGTIVTSQYKTHPAAIGEAQQRGLKTEDFESGFITTSGEFLNNKEALQRARAIRQIGENEGTTGQSHGGLEAKLFQRQKRFVRPPTRPPTRPLKEAIAQEPAIPTRQTEQIVSEPHLPQTAATEPGIALDQLRKRSSYSEPTATSTKNATTFAEPGISKIGKSIEAKAVEAKLTQGFEGTVNYDPIKMQEQAHMATGFIKTSLPNARAVIRGEAPLPEGLRGTSLITAMEEHISRQPNTELAYELANSPLVRATSEAAQEMRLMAERVPDGITAAFEEIKEARRAGSKQRGETVERVAQEIKAEVVRNASKRPTWEAFVKSLECV